MCQEYLMGNVLDLGCGAGAFGEQIKALPHVNRVDGVEIVGSVIPSAEKNLDSVVNCDLMNFGAWEFLLSRVDTVTILDALEHVSDHKLLLANIFSKLKRGGIIILSVPNAQNHKVIRRLINGKFFYEDDGLMDYTHLRWFTQVTLVSEVLSLGFEVEKVTRYNFSKSIFATIAKSFVPQFMAKQILVVAKKK